MTGQEALISLNMVSGLGSIKLRRMQEAFGSSHKILSVSKSELKKIAGIGDKIAEEIIKAKDNPGLKKELDLVKKHKVKIITINDKDYPKNLKEIYDPPIVLYLKGSLEQDDGLALAIVGSRRASFYGLSIAEKLAGELSGVGLTIISGMARGIDSAAHRGALKAGGRTLAILGSGLSNIYPPENKPLFEKIQTQGAVISEFPMQMEPLAQNFPRRNRIISGLSIGVVVVEAARNSGAIITADCALEQGREVFAVPGKIDSATSWGTNKLIKQGAKLVEDSQDIIEELKPRLKTLLKEIPAQNKSKEAKESSKPPSSGLTKEESNIFNLLTANPRHIDEIIDESGWSAPLVMSALMRLELKHLIKQLPGKLFVKV